MEDKLAGYADEVRVGRIVPDGVESVADSSSRDKAMEIRVNRRFKCPMCLKNRSSG